MPTISIDTFFACTIMIAVVIGATVLSSEILGTHIAEYQNLNEDNYLKALSQNILLNNGMPADWGSNGSMIPYAFGLAKSNSLSPTELDIDKISRLNSQNVFALTYQELLNAAKLNDIALGVSVTQLLDISVTPYSSSTLGNSTTYVFEVSVSEYNAPVKASLNCYVIAKNFLSSINGSTSPGGVGFVDIEIPNASNGTASLIVFARATYDSRMTSYAVHLFEHSSTEQLPTNSFLRLSPLDYTLWVSANYSDIILEKVYAFSYEYESNLIVSSNSTYTIPLFLDKSPIVLVLTGVNASTFFIEWTAYPQIPLDAGADFTNAECHTFSYVANVGGALYSLKIRFGGLSQ
jgi:hypothetical protein